MVAILKSSMVIWWYVEDIYQYLSETWYIEKTWHTEWISLAKFQYNITWKKSKSTQLDVIEAIGFTTEYPFFRRILLEKSIVNHGQFYIRVSFS